MGIFDKKDKDKKDKPKADFSGVQSGSSSTARDQDSSTSPDREVKTYTVASGDSLSKIAKREYGDANKWPRIYEANKDKIKNPDLIHPGQVLNIPRDA